MSDTAYLALENGMVFEGKYFGARGSVTGEVVFATEMTGYLEALTDKSYFGQIILQTFPLIGNYGVIPSDFESCSIEAGGYIVKHWCREPSNFRSEGDLDAFLKSRNVVGLYGVDTRALTKIIRENGVMNGRITDTRPSPEDINAIGKHKTENAVESVSVREVTRYEAQSPKFKVAVMDLGLTESAKHELLKRGCEVWAFPHNSGVKELLQIKPDGILISSGPGDPAANTGIISNLKELAALGIPMFGIGLGHQLLALANGFKTSKLKYGHRGGNQPVKDLDSGRVYITTQNHGYSVIPESIDPQICAQSFVNLNDNTCEGIIYKNSPVFSVQFYPGGLGGKADTAFLFDRFILNMEEHGYAAE